MPWPWFCHLFYSKSCWPVLFLLSNEVFPRESIGKKTSPWVAGFSYIPIWWEMAVLRELGKLAEDLLCARSRGRYKILVPYWFPGCQDCDLGLMKLRGSS